MTEKGKGLHMFTYILMVVGGLNWLLLGAFQWEVTELFGGSSSTAGRVVFVIIGLATIYNLATHNKNCKVCDKGSKSAPAPMTGTSGNM